MFLDKQHQIDLQTVPVRAVFSYKFKENALPEVIELSFLNDDDSEVNCPIVRQAAITEFLKLELEYFHRLENKGGL